MNRWIAQLLVFGIGGAVWGIARSVPHGADAARPPAHAPDDPSRIELTVRFFEKRTVDDPGGATGIAMLASAYLNRFYAQFDDADLARAETTARKSIALRPHNNPIARYTLARAQMAQHRFGDALKSSAAIPALRGECYLERGDYDDATRVLGQAALAPPDDPAVKALRARLWEIDGRPDRALGLYREALGKVDSEYESPASTRAWFQSRVAACLASQGRIGEATEAFQLALETCDRDPRLLIAFGRMQANRREWEDARALAERAEAIAPTPEGAMLLADVAAAQNRPAEAERWRQRAFDGRTALHSHGRTLALFLTDHGGDLDEAERLVRQDLLQRHDIYAWDALAWVLFRRGDLAGAQQAAQKALARGTRDASLWYHAGRIAHARGETDRARRDLETALAINPFFHPTAPEEIRQLLKEFSR